MRPKIADVVSVERLRELRGQGWTFAEIGKEVGFCQRTVALYAREVLTKAEFEQVERVSDKRKRIRRFLDAHDGWEGTACDLADRLAVSVSLVNKMRAQWRRARSREEEGRCTRCKFLGEEGNPVGPGGLCLWCRLEERGVSLLEFHQSGMAVELLGEAVLSH